MLINLQKRSVGKLNAVLAFGKKDSKKNYEEERQKMMR